ncbi:uncharacterized protein LOC9309756 [Arabidopsis lyrata subsp. lyrata]|nr:uncharacterized protein LOC9309756 [Arabidopsis lyrata subsp. lyrata]|eukprot:XP_020877101.1 uncharacterized protein LOC9309756 [Arabidopsis lyrata subsp. lyrata]
MNRVKIIQNFITEEHIMSTMQDLSSTVSFSPSFSFYASGDLVEAAVRVVRESESYSSVKVDGENDKEFEFETLPLGDESFFHFPMTTATFKRSSDDDDVADDRVTSKNLFYDGWSLDPSPSPPSPSQSHSSSDSDDSENLSPSCFWSPIRSPARGDSLKIKSKSSSEPRRCRIKDFLRRSHSDGSVSTASASKRCIFKNLLRRSHSDGGGQESSVSTSGNGSPVVKERNKTASYKPEVDKRRKSYLPYRQDLIGVFAGISRFRH